MGQWFLAFGATLLLVVMVGLVPPGSPTAAAQSSSILGTWSLVWEGARDNYTGTLDVTTRVTDQLFTGRLNLIKSNGVQIGEDTDITITGNEVRIECSRPSDPRWNPDRFYVTRSGDRMEGYSLDTAGQRGRTIVFTKQ